MGKFGVLKGLISAVLQPLVAGAYAGRHAEYLGGGVFITTHSYMREDMRWCEYHDGDRVLRIEFDKGRAPDERLVYSSLFRVWRTPQGTAPVSARERDEVLSRLSHAKQARYVDKVFPPDGAEDETDLPVIKPIGF